jgi:hypothetical protein
MVAQTLVVAAIFLWVAGFFSSWDGQAVGVLTPRGSEPAVYEVVIQQADGSTVRRSMPSVLVLGMGLPVLDLGIPPETIPADAPQSRKSRFQLHYLVQTRPEGSEEFAWRSAPTTTPQAFGLALIIWIVALGIRNMAYGGSPFWIERQRHFFLPKAQTASGNVAQTNTRTRRSAPPPRKQRGPRR